MLDRATGALVRRFSAARADCTLCLSTWTTRCSRQGSHRVCWACFLPRFRSGSTALSPNGRHVSTTAQMRLIAADCADVRALCSCRIWSRTQRAYRPSR